jgi:hypothetical protein
MHSYAEEMNTVSVSILIAIVVCASFLPQSTTADLATVYFTLYEDENATNWTITAGGGYLADHPFPLTDIDIIVRKADFTIGLWPTAASNLSSVSFINGVSYHDVSDPAHLNKWDYFVLNKTMYAVGSSMAIVSSDGTSTFASITIGSGSPAPPRPSTDYLPIVALISAAAISGVCIALYFHRKRKAGDD